MIESSMLQVPSPPGAAVEQPGGEVVYGRHDQPRTASAV